MTTSREPASTTTAAETRSEEETRSEPSDKKLSTADFAASASASGPVTRQEVDHADTGGRAALFAGNESQDFQSRWSDIQASFVDEPRRAVEQADGLVAEVMQRLAQVFADERGKLERQWSSGEDTDTEALRQALRRYRSFFDRLLSM
jgi:hypothetical protein